MDDEVKSNLTTYNLGAASAENEILNCLISQPSKSLVGISSNMWFAFFDCCVDPNEENKPWSEALIKEMR